MFKIDLPKIESLIRSIIEQMDFRLYDIQFNEVSRTLRIFIDRDQGNVTINDCEKVSKIVSDELDKSNLIDFQHTLEVSSPGVERFLTKIEHFQWARGKLAEITLKHNKIRGYIRDVDGQSVTIAQSSGETIIKLQDIVKAKLVEELEYGN
ncbi:MAG: ribosome maturation factor RimP [candidate division WOR-3 bacterium]